MSKFKVKSCGYDDLESELDRLDNMNYEILSVNSCTINEAEVVYTIIGRIKDVTS